MNRGTRMGTKALARFTRLPVSKSAPLAFWADIILSVSSIRVGMNRRAMHIIMLSSCTGIWSFFSGPISDSKPSVREMGEVVKVMRKVPVISIRILPIIKIARVRPSLVMVSFQMRISTVSPPVKNRFSTPVNTRIITRGFMPLTMDLGGMAETRISTRRNTSMIP